MNRYSLPPRDDMDFAEQQLVFTRQRFLQLRLQKGVSFSEMSLSLGRTRSYMRSIDSSSRMPVMHRFFDICEYLNISPQDFFDPTVNFDGNKQLELPPFLGDKDCPTFRI